MVLRSSLTRLESCLEAVVVKELPQKAASPLAAEEAYKGQAFEKNAVEWMVPDVLWNKEDEEVVVHYYDRAGAAREGLSEEKIRDPIGMNEYCDCMERMDVSEIRQWVKDEAIRMACRHSKNTRGAMVKMIAGGPGVFVSWT